MKPTAPRRRASRSVPEIVVITGLSGSGKSHVLRALEDLGWFCVDNLPTALVPRFVELVGSSAELRRCAVVADVREPDFLSRFPAAYRQVKERGGVRATLLFLEAEEKVLLRRFSETRRPHPMAENEPVVDAVRDEREALRPIRKMADRILDTSTLTVHQLRAQVREQYGGGDGAVTVISVVSFGFKYGIPAEADLVFDVRFLPNPNFVPRLKRLTGSHPAVVRYMKAQPELRAFLRRLLGFLRFVVPRYVREGKSYLTIAIGCTGGRHRSVMIANAVRDDLAARRLAAKVRHRDLGLR
ncbi:MAG TPA: RNase adapter RapZ [Vicinamibacteria bacterium]|nr:RNase adapter RapZ [Vicinamibacteria bacterium]